MTTTPDATDWKIIRLLQQDGRSANAAIAAQLHVAEGTVRSRIKKLLEAGILKIAGLLNPEYLEGHQLVIVAIKIAQSRQLEQTAQAVAKLPQVTSVAITSGRYDMMAHVIVESNKGIIHFLADPLAKIDGIVSTETFLFLKTVNCWV